MGLLTKGKKPIKLADVNTTIARFGLTSFHHQHQAMQIAAAKVWDYENEKTAEQKQKPAARAEYNAAMQTLTAMAPPGFDTGKRQATTASTAAPSPAPAQAPAPAPAPTPAPAPAPTVTTDTSTTNVAAAPTVATDTTGAATTTATPAPAATTVPAPAPVATTNNDGTTQPATATAAAVQTNPSTTASSVQTDTTVSSVADILAFLQSTMTPAQVAAFAANKKAKVANTDSTTQTGGTAPTNNTTGAPLFPMTPPNGQMTTGQMQNAMNPPPTPWAGHHGMQGQPGMYGPTHANTITPQGAPYGNWNYQQAKPACEQAKPCGYTTCPHSQFAGHGSHKGPCTSWIKCGYSTCPQCGHM